MLVFVEFILNTEAETSPYFPFEAVCHCAASSHV